MTDRDPPPLDDEARALFARKGLEGGAGVPQAGEANGVKVRRILQLVADLAPAPFPSLRILDLGCGEGVYAIEAALRGAEVVAVDARRSRMAEGAACARRHGLGRLRFLEADARSVRRETHGEFDVVLLLGLLYHFDAPDLFERVMEARALARHLLLVDTLVAPEAAETPETFSWRGRAYCGRRVREHADDDPPEARRARPLRSIDNAFGVRLTRESLVRLLVDCGFTSVLECHAPLEPGRAPDRITLAARIGAPVRLASYPWVNGLSEEEIAARLAGGA